MSCEKNKLVTVQFVPDEDVDFCGSLSTEAPSSKQKRVINKRIEVEVTSEETSNSDEGIQYTLQHIKSKNSKLQRASSMRTIRESDLLDKSTKSSHKLRSSTHFNKAPYSERRRKSLRKPESTVKTVATNQSEFELQTPEKRRRISKAEENVLDDYEIQENRNTPENNKLNVETSRRSSRRIQSINKNKKVSKNSTFNELPRSKCHELRSTERKSYHYESDSSATDESSSSEPEEMSSKIPVGAYNIQDESKKPNSNSTLIPSRKTLQKSNSNCKSSVLSTPKSNQLFDRNQLRTPATVRRKLTKQFAAMSRKLESDDESSSVNELEHSSDEFVPSSSESDSTEDEENSDSSDTDESTQPMPIRERISKLNSHILEKKKTIDVDLPYKIDADDYFLSKCSKEPTSNNQLSSLEVSHLEEDEIKNLLRNEYTKHGGISDSLIHKYKNEFSKWLFYLKENFNLLMYGLGSKIELLEYFHSEILSAYDVLTIHGYFPRLLVKDILNSLITDVLKINAPKNASEALPVIKSTLRSRKSPVFVIIHNVDRLICRQRKQQSVISKLASFPNLHMIVSIDHINAPLFWGNSMLTELKFIWMNITTYQPYVNETSFENLIYLNEAGTDFVSLSSLRNIFKPLASRVKKIFQIIAKDRLENANNRHYKGMSYEEWYHRAKEELLVNNITVFKVQLTELIDHGIIKINDHQCIPIMVKLDILEKFYKEMYGNEEE